MHTCPACQNTHHQVKDGRTAAGSQRIRCQVCRKRYTPVAKARGCTPDLRARAVQLYVDGMNFRRIARTLGVHHRSVIRWVTAAADRLPDVPPRPDTVATVEMDELFTFIGEKKTAPTS